MTKTQKVSLERFQKLHKLGESLQKTLEEFPKQLEGAFIGCEKMYFEESHAILSERKGKPSIYLSDSQLGAVTQTDFFSMVNELIENEDDSLIEMWGSALRRALDTISNRKKRS